MYERILHKHSTVFASRTRILTHAVQASPFKSERIEIDQQTVKFEEAIREETKNIKHWKREISKLKLEDIPGEEVEELRNYHDNEEGKQKLNQLNSEGKLIRN